MDAATATQPAKIRDIELKAGETLEWSPEQREVSISKMAVQAVTKAKEISTWYLTKKAKKQKWAVRYRGGAIVCTAVAAVLPILAEMDIKIVFFGIGPVVVRPALASVVLALAGTLIALDQFGGFSSAWMR